MMKYKLSFIIVLLAISLSVFGSNWSGTSTTSTSSVLLLDYSSSSQFTYTSTSVEFTSGAARLVDQYGSYYYVASFHSDVNGTYSREGGSLTNSINGSVSSASGKLTITGGSFAELVVPVALNFPATHNYAVKLKYTPNYTGTPADDQEILSISIGDGDNTNLTRIVHQTSDGKLYFITTGESATKSINASWSPTSGTEYELAFGVDMTSGEYKAYINGVQHGSTLTGSQTRKYWLGLFKIGETYTSTGHVANFKLRDLVFYDTYAITGAYTPGYTIQDVRYLTSDPTITQTTGVSATSYLSFSAGSTATGSDAVKFHIKVGGTAKYWNGSAWATSNGSYAQSNTASDINTNIPTLTAGTTQVVAVLHSNDGSTTPSVSSVALAYR